MPARRDVVEVHGSIRTSTAPAAARGYPLAEVLALLEPRRTARLPARLRRVLKPDVVFFDELLPEGAMERAFELAAEARLLLVVGSSLEVYPVAGLPRETLRRAAGRSRSSTERRRGSTREPTRSCARARVRSLPRSRRPSAHPACVPRAQAVSGSLQRLGRLGKRGMTLCA